MVLTLMIPARAIYKPLGDLVTVSHVDKMCKVIVFTGSIVGYAYLMELFMAWFSGNPYERAAFWYRMTGPYWWAYACMILCNVIAPQLFWFRAIRNNLLLVWIIVQFPNVGMWYERFVIIATSLARDFTPSAWGMFHPTWVDIAMFTGSLGLFTTLFLIFIRFLPMVCMFEVKAVLPEANPHRKEGA